MRGAAARTDLGARGDLGPALGTGRGSGHSGRRKHRPGQAHARDDRRRGTLAAFGGALANPFDRLARGGSLEAARQLRVLHVAAALLWRLLVFPPDPRDGVVPPGAPAAVAVQDLPRPPAGR